MHDTVLSVLQLWDLLLYQSRLLMLLCIYTMYRHNLFLHIRTLKNVCILFTMYQLVKYNLI